MDRKCMKWSDVKVTQSCLTFWDPMDYTVHGILQARLLEWVASCSLFQGIFPSQELNPGLMHGRWILYHLSHQESPRLLKWVAAHPFSRGSSWPRNWTGVSWIVGRFFTSWATREAQVFLLPIKQRRKLREKRLYDSPKVAPLQRQGGGISWQSSS